MSESMRASLQPQCSSGECGFNNSSITRAYLERFPDDPHLTSLASLEAFEDENPAAFLGMIQFGVQKRGMSANGNRPA